MLERNSRLCIPQHYTATAAGGQCRLSSERIQECDDVLLSLIARVVELVNDSRRFPLVTLDCIPDLKGVAIVHQPGAHVQTPQRRRT